MILFIEGCCTEDFSCSTKILLRDESASETKYVLSLNQSNLTIHDIVVVKKLPEEFSCMPSDFYNKTGITDDTVVCRPNLSPSHSVTCSSFIQPLNASFVLLQVLSYTPTSVWKQVNSPTRYI